MNREALIQSELDAEQADYAMAELHLQAFVKLAWQVLEPSTELKWNWHLTLLCEYMEDIYYGRVTRGLVNIPPRSLKSTIVTICYPVWVWTKKPSTRFMCTSYAEGLSTKHNVDRRTLIRSEWFQRGWAHKFQLTDDEDTKQKFTNTRRGHMIATSMLGTATGLGGNCLIVDDPHDTTIAESETKRKATIEAFDQKFYDRLDDKKKDTIIIVMQRLHVEDLTGHVLKQGGFTHLCLPAIAEKKDEKQIVIDGVVERHVFPRSGRVVERKEGELLHDSREGEKEIAELKLRLGSRGFAGKFQQRPTAREGGLIKRAWIRYWQYSDLPPRYEEEVQSWDCSFEDADTSDFVCGLVLKRMLGQKYLMPGIINEQMDVVATMRAIIRMSQNEPRTFAKLVERKANGHAIIQMLGDKIPGIIGVEPESSKESRLQAHEADFEAGNILFPHPDIYPPILEFVEQLVNFPAVPNDDFVDALTQGLDRLREGAVSFTEEMVQGKITSITGGFKNGGDRW